ncbi:hypothetical protein R6U77_14940 [Lysinibacillus louembei]|uniref:Uncharacterized protein n=1 Tax=Lysinibacillus louembei TaxID=1470088 RepID=A0ABZ0RSG0_9BACI|nr:hypothetical protein [Lysinibacillus louembei]WPK11172.1 hypothetical protein R6U77_14940 [Lysinibacillus louembei]
MKKNLFIILISLAVFLVACSSNMQEDIIATGKFRDYQYSIEKQDQQFIWQIGYQHEFTTIEETINNKIYLEKFMITVNEGKMAFSFFIICLGYLLFIVLAVVFAYKKRKTLLTNGAVTVAGIAATITCYMLFKAILDLNRLLLEVDYLYLLINSL